MKDTRKAGTDSPDVAAELADPAFLAEVREQMLRFAVLQLSDEHAAEDAVQEALAGALRNARSFGRRAALKTWIFAILKNKIVDLLRQRQRELQTSSLLREEDNGEELDLLFDERGHWRQHEAPSPWGHPADAAQDEQFWRVFETCLDGLPAKLARVFMMREFLELESGEICSTLDITTSNHHVMLHRARLRLRECLEKRWYLEGERP